MKACASCAISGVAVRPVPIAQTGSYASTRSECGSSTDSWRPRTSSVSPRSRSACVSPTQAITRRPASSAAQARLATVSSVSPKYWRRSEWPTREPTAPSSSSSGAEISPVYAPSCSQCTFCAYVVRPASTHSRRRVNGGQTTASSPARAAGSGPRNIFQLPAISIGRSYGWKRRRRSRRRPAEHRTTPLGVVPGGWDRRHAGQLLALEQLEARAAAGRDPRDAVGETELVERAHRVGSAHDREGILVGGDRLGDRPGSLGERRPLEDAHR